MRRPFQILLGLIPWAYAQEYCARIYHSVIVNDRTLYVAGGGGESRWITDATNITFGRVPGLQAIDLSKSWSNSDTDLYKDIDTQNPPSLNAGGAFTNGTDLYFYGGYIDWEGVVPPLATYEYSIQNDHWDYRGLGSLWTRTGLGSTAQSTVNNKAYYLGGVVHPGADPQVAGTPGAEPHIVQGLLSFDQNTNQWTNFSTKDMNNYGTVVDGYLNLIESVGDEGILVSYGGFKRPAGQGVSILTAHNVEPSAHNSMEYVSVYDIANNKWYTQQATGDIPEWRMGGCSVVAPAQDESSFSIYTWGGLGTNTTKPQSDGDVYVLSVPSFKWIRVNKGYKIRHKHKCQLVNKHTMLSVGGTVPPRMDSEHQPAPVDCDRSGRWANGLAIFDLRSHQWGTDYDAEDQGEYTLASAITNVIGGSETGGATVTKPDNGFNGTALEALLSKRNKSLSSANSSNLSGGAIAGITVGVVAAVAIAIAALVFFLIARRRRRNQAAIQDQKGHIPLDPRSDTYTNPAELESKQAAHEMGTGASVYEKPPDGVIAEVPAREPPAAELSAETDGTGARS